MTAPGFHAENFFANLTEAVKPKKIRSKKGCSMENDFNDRDLGAERGAAGIPKQTRRLSDKVLIAFHHACDQADFDVANDLLVILEKMLKRPNASSDSNRRKSIESLVAAHERLWLLRHPEAREN
ncbi:MAG: hypothetical protein ACK5WN_16970 [Alphaproteobacteria bacterium]|nr:hypothetical protein [Roseomonas sp.]